MTDSLTDRILTAWDTNARVTEGLIASLPAAVYGAEVPGVPRRTVRMIAAHLHNSRRMWLRTLAVPLGLAAPAAVDRRAVSKAELRRALGQSARGMRDLLEYGCRHEGRIPPTAKYVWRNLDLDVGHVLTYFVGHEAHHRGQLALIARQLGVPLPRSVANDLWQWKPPRPAAGAATPAVRVPGWRLESGQLVRTFRFPSFVEAFGFMAAAATVAERMNHHPDWSNSWNQVTVRLSSHDAGRVTERDVALARAMNGLATAAETRGR